MLRVSLLRLGALCLLPLAAAERPTQDAHSDAADGFGVRATGGFEALSHRKSLPDVERHLLPEAAVSGKAASLLEEGTADADGEGHELPTADADGGGHEATGAKEEEGAGYTVPENLQSKKPVAYETKTLEEKKEHDKAKYQTTEKGALKISDVYGPTIMDLRKQEKLIFNDDFKVEELRKEGTGSFTANKNYHDALETYIEQLYRMSHGAQKATKQEFDQQMTTAKSLSDEIHKGNMDATFKTELNQKKGHVTAEQHAKLSESKHVDNLEAVEAGKGHPTGGNEEEEAPKKKKKKKDD